MPVFSTIRQPLGGTGMDANTLRKPYRSDLTDEQWHLLTPLLPPPVPAGAPRTTDLREVVNAILYRLHNGCAWHALPHDLPAEGTVREYFHRWRRGGLLEKINPKFGVNNRRYHPTVLGLGWNRRVRFLATTEATARLPPATASLHLPAQSCYPNRPLPPHRCSSSGLPTVPASSENSALQNLGRSA